LQRLESLSHGEKIKSEVKLKRGCSLFSGSDLLDIEKPFLKNKFNARVTTTSIMTDDGLSLTPRQSAGDDVSTSRGSLRSTKSKEATTPTTQLTVPDGVFPSLVRGASRSSAVSSKVKFTKKKFLNIQKNNLIMYCGFCLKRTVSKKKI
jgi:hypothetical protein